MSVARAQCEIPAREFVEWIAYYKTHPWGDERGDLRAGIVASTMANLWAKKRTKPEDFMPKFGPPRRQSRAEAAAISNAFIATHNAAIKASRHGQN